MDDETMFLCGFKRLPKYGTTSGPDTSSQSISSQRLYNKIVKHKLLPSDTLQGIALKYNSSTTEIKRINKLWSNDSIHLVDELKIPVVVPTNDLGTSERYIVGSGFEIQKQNRSRDSSHKSDQDLEKIKPNCLSYTPSFPPTGEELSTNEIKFLHFDSGSLSNLITTSQSPYDKSYQAFSDIFERIDTSLKVTAKNVRRLEEQSNVDKIVDCCDDDKESLCGTSYKNTAFIDIPLSGKTKNQSSSSHTLVKVEPISHNGAKKKSKSRVLQEFVPLQDIATRQQAGQSPCRI